MSLLDANPFTGAYYIPLVETKNIFTGGRQYSWGAYKWLTPFDAVTYANSFSRSTPQTTTAASLYQWDNSSGWLKTSISSGL